ncbi:MAG: DUF4114 domain-containing protein [Cyanobacteria bacterium P01_D01_bin.50]
MATEINKFDDSNLQSQNSFSSVLNNALPQSPTNNLDVSAATYLGGAEDDLANAVDISADGNFVILGGSVRNTNLEVEETELLDGGDGSIVVYDSQTNQAVTITRLPGIVWDLEVSKNGDIAVAYEGGIAVLNADATEVKWSQSLSNVSRIAISDSGKVGVVEDIESGDKAKLFDSTGEELQQWNTNSSDRHFYDIAVTDQNRGMVITTGYDQKAPKLQVAFTQAWSNQGENLWNNYDFGAPDISQENLMADTRGTRVAIGGDGKLYSSYYVNGGTGSSIFYRDPHDLSEKLTDDRKIENDNYNTPTNVSSIQMVWYGRYDLNNGDLIKGQSLLGRNNGKGSSVNVNSIGATEDGTVILSGGAAARIANRDQQTIEGQSVSEYVSYDGYIATISPDLKQRLSWTPISRSNGGVAAATRGGTTAAVSTTNFTGNQITHNAIQDSTGGQKDGYLLVIGGNDAPPGTAPTISQENPLPIDGSENPPPVDEVGDDNPIQQEVIPVIEAGDDNPIQQEVIPVIEAGDDNPIEEEVIPVIEAGDENPIEEEVIPVIEVGDDNPIEEEVIPVIEAGDDNPIQQEVIPVIEAGDDNPIQQEVIPVIEAGDDNPIQQEVIPVIEAGDDNPIQQEIIPVIQLGDDNPIQENLQPIIEGGSDNPDSVFPAGLLDLTEIDLNGDNQIDETVAVNFSDITSEAGYNNSIGYYAIANINGAVKDSLTGELINPEDEGYAKAALNQRVEDLELRRDTGNLTDELSTGVLLVPFLIANGTVEEWIETNSNNENGNDPIAYFSFLGANPDNQTHIRQVGNELQFEDLFGGGDNDFNDFVTEFNIQSVL